MSGGGGGHEMAFSSVRDCFGRRGCGERPFLRQPKAVADQDDQIVFPYKVFYNSDAVVTIAGTLTGSHLANPNNTYNITCYRDQKECVVSSIEQIGHNQMGTLR
jgi:hypothetical protein